MKLKVFFVLILIFSFLTFSCSVMDKIESNKELKIVSFGVETKNKSKIMPGQEVTLFAKANRVNDVLYTFNCAGEVIESTKPQIKWKIPEIAGKYTIIVTAQNLKDGKKAEYSEDLIVNKDGAELSFKDFKVKVKTHTNIVSKGLNEEKDSEMEIEANNNVLYTTITNDEGTFKYMIKDGNLYEVMDEKAINNTKLIVENCFPSLDNMEDIVNPSSISIMDILKNNFDNNYTETDKEITFYKKDYNSEISIVFNKELNRIVMMKTIDGKMGIVSATKYSYINSNGHILLSKIENGESSLESNCMDGSLTAMEFEWSSF